MSHTHSTADMTGLMGDPAFKALLKSAQADYLSWDQFLRMPLPAGASAMDTWNLLVEVRRAQAETLPVASPDTRLFWYNRTLRISDALSVLDRECGFDSRLYKTITAGWGSRFLVRSRIEEVAAAAQMDGLNVSDDAVRRLLYEKCTPRSGAERVIANMMGVMARLPEYAERPFSFQLMQELRDLLLEGVDPASLEYTEHADGLLAAGHRLLADSQDWSLSPEERAAHLCAQANGEMGAPYFHPAARALFLADAPTSSRPLPDMNSPVGRLMFQLYAFKNGLPVLGLLPITRAKIMWALGQAPYDEVSITPKSYFSWIDSDPYDFTPSMTLLMELTMLLLDRLKEAVQRAEQRDAELLGILPHDASLNRRQRLVIGRCLRDPHAEFRVAYHKTLHSVTHTTARMDLVSLVDAGYLVRVARGRAYVYLPAPSLYDRLGACPTDRPNTPAE